MFIDHSDIYPIMNDALLALFKRVGVVAKTRVG